MYLVSEVPVNEFLAFLQLQSQMLNLPDREISILAVACVDLRENYNIDARAEAVVVQTDAGRNH